MVTRRRGRSRGGRDLPKPRAKPRDHDGGKGRPPGASAHARGRVRNLGRKRVAQNAGEPDHAESDGHL